MGLARVIRRLRKKAEEAKARKRRRKSLFEALEQRLLLDTVTWDGGGDGQSWRDALNWDKDILPAASDDVLIGGTGPAVVHSSQNNDSITSLHTSRPLTLSGGSLSIAAASEITDGLNLANATLTGAGTLTFGGASTWTGGTMAGTGKTVIGSGATLEISGAGNKILDGRTIDNQGTITWTSGTLVGINGAAIVNRDGAFFDDQNPASHSLSTSITGIRPQFTIEAGAVFRKSGAGAATFQDVIFNNAGTVLEL